MGGVPTTLALAVEGHFFRDWIGTHRSVPSSAAMPSSMGKGYEQCSPRNSHPNGADNFN